MYHPLYHVARRHVGKVVTAHHVNGRRYSGHLVSVVPQGIYMIPTATTASSDTNALDSSHALGSEEPLNVEEVYGPAAFFGFGALAGLGLGAMAGAYMW